MTNINWKVRIKNPMFWVQIVVAIFVPVLGYMGITAQDLTTWQAVGNVILTADRKSVVVGKECLRLCRSRWSPYH